MDTNELAVQEWKLTQSIVLAQAGMRFKLAGWLITLLSALTFGLFFSGTAITTKIYIFTGYSLVLLFWMADQLVRSVQVVTLQRSVEIEDYLSSEIEKYDGPRLTRKITVVDDPGEFAAIVLKDLKTTLNFLPYILLFILVTVFGFSK